MPIVRWRDTDGAQREQRTPEPGAFVARLVAEHGAAGLGDPAGLEVVRPSLEDVYLELIAEHESTPELESTGQEVAA